MKLLKELTNNDFPDKEWEPHGYDMTQLPSASKRNFKILVDKYNEIVVFCNKITEKFGIEDESDHV